jgi:hypothetical protein
MISWNMDGAITAGVDQWQNYIAPLILDHAPDVIMLQEAGAGPPGSAVELPNPTGDGRVSVYRWSRGGSRADTWRLIQPAV